MVTLDPLTFRYGPRATPIIQDFSWTVREGEVVVVIGRPAAARPRC